MVQPASHEEREGECVVFRPCSRALRTWQASLTEAELHPPLPSAQPPRFISSGPPGEAYGHPELVHTFSPVLVTAVNGRQKNYS